MEGAGESLLAVDLLSGNVLAESKQGSLFTPKIKKKNNRPAKRTTQIDNAKFGAVPDSVSHIFSLALNFKQTHPDAPKRALVDYHGAKPPYPVSNAALRNVFLSNMRLPS